MVDHEEKNVFSTQVSSSNNWIQFSFGDREIVESEHGEEIYGKGKESRFDFEDTIGN